MRQNESKEKSKKRKEKGIISLHVLNKMLTLQCKKKI